MGDWLGALLTARFWSGRRLTAPISINSIKNIEGVEIAILFREIEAQRVKISFRSKMWADVNQLAACFGGGGHVRAAGCTILEAMPEVQEKVLREALAVLAKGE